MASRYVSIVSISAALFIVVSAAFITQAGQDVAAQVQNVANDRATQIVMQETATVMAERSARTVQIRATLIEPTVEQIVSNQVFILAHQAEPSLVKVMIYTPIATIYPTVIAQPTAIPLRAATNIHAIPFVATMPAQPTSPGFLTVPSGTPAPFELAPTVTSESPQATDIPIVVIVLEPTPTYAATATLEPTWTPAPTPRPTDIPKPTDAPTMTPEATATESVLVSPLATPTMEATLIP